MIATQPQTRQLLGVNQQSYQSLKASMELNLRRQLLVAVCDSVVMQNQLATQLEYDLNQDRTPNLLDEFDDFEGLSPASLTAKKPLARLIFDPEDGNLPKQVAQWVRQTILAEGSLPQVQVLGIEQMTRQPAITQNHFLRSLEKVDALLPRLNTSLLIWVPWPWLRTIQQSAPTFWNWRNGVFEFVSDPTPVSQDSQQPALDTAADQPQAAIYPPAKPAHTEQTAEKPAESIAKQSLTLTLLQEDEDDLSSLFDEETTLFEQPERDLPDSSAELYGETGSSQRPTPRRSLAALSGLTSIVTKGVNAQSNDPHDDLSNSPQEQSRQPVNLDLETETPAHINRSAESAAQASEQQAFAPAIPPVEVIETTTTDETIFAEPDEPLDEADYLAEGRAYRARIEAGERELSVIESAIAAYEAGLRQLHDKSSDWSVGLNDLGTLYWLKAQQLDDIPQSIAEMTHSIELYQDALERLKPEQSELVGQLYSNMGAVYSMLATYQDSVAFLNQAMAAYRQALPTSSLENDPLEYATLHNSLGSVYWKLSHYEQVQSHLHQAIAAYSEALSGYRPEAQPLDYAAVQNNLGITYWSLAKHEEPQSFLQQAIAAYSDALNYRTLEADPAACAITYNNLALAYWDLSKVSDLEPARKVQAQKNAVTAFEAALNTSQTSNALSHMDSTAIYHCLGDVHGQMAETAPTLVDVGERLSKALYSYIQSLKGLSADSPAYQGRIGAIVANLRSHYEHLGLEGQQIALGKVPADLLAQVLAAL